MDGQYVGETQTINGKTYHTLYLYDDAGNIIGLQENGETYYFSRTLQGDVTAILDESGTKVARYVYDTWGNIVGVYDGADDEVTDPEHIGLRNPFRYRGYMYDEESGLYYLQSRYYDPVTGRFVNADGFVSTGTGLMGHNMFAYCNNNPVMNVDPNGQFISAALGAGAIATLFLVVAAGILSLGIANTAPSATLPGTISPPVPEDIIGGDTLLPKAKAKDEAKAKEKEKTVKIPPADTVVYRYGGTNPGNFVPREGIDITGLSFSTKPPVRGKAAVTTIGALNATGMVLAFQDGATHISVLPNPSVGTIDDWIAGGVDHPCTNAVKSVCVKWDGCQ